MHGNRLSFMCHKNKFIPLYVYNMCYLVILAGFYTVELALQFLSQFCILGFTPCHKPYLSLIFLRTKYSKNFTAWGH